MRVEILGASNKPERYSYQALQRLRENGHDVFPVHPAIENIEGITTFSSLEELPQPIDILTMYVNPQISNKNAEKILTLKPKRVIFNPGTENSGLQNQLEAAGIRVQEACTLVLLATKQFEK
ncbi:MAG: CoA-binding protein [Fibrobacter sp.]|nr:CoA-binding protein [Fibrobacter sp.]